MNAKFWIDQARKDLEMAAYYSEIPSLQCLVDERIESAKHAIEIAQRMTEPEAENGLV